MARVTNGLFGITSGRVGKHVYRNIRGKNFVSIRPESYNISDSPKSIANRKKFGLTSSFAKFICSNESLRQIWKQNSRDKSYTYHKIIKANACLTKEETLTTFNSIVPDNRLNLINKFSLEEGIIKADISLEKLTEVFLPSGPVSFIFILFTRSNQKSKEKEFNFSIITVESEAGAIPQQIIFPVTEDIFTLIQKSKSGIIYNTITQKQSGKFQWTSTASAKF